LERFERAQQAAILRMSEGVDEQRMNIWSSAIVPLIVAQFDNDLAAPNRRGQRGGAQRGGGTREGVVKRPIGLSSRSA
jgi:hypothetical protein